MLINSIGCIFFITTTTTKSGNGHICVKNNSWLSSVHVFVPLFDVNSLPDDKILKVTKLKQFPDDKINVAQMTISVCNGVENIVRKGENAGYQHFLLFLQCSQMAFCPRVVESRDFVVKG